MKFLGGWKVNSKGGKRGTGGGEGRGKVGGTYSITRRTRSTR